SVTDVVVAPGALLDDDELTQLVASIERSSEHAVADAVVRFAQGRVALRTVTEFESSPGRGVRGDVSGVMVIAGTESFLAESGIDVAPMRDVADRLAESAKTPVYVGVGGTLAGLVAVADPIKPTSRRAIERLHGLGLDVVMLSGDHPHTANAV